MSAIDDLYNEQAAQLANYNSLWTTYVQPLEVLQVTDAVQTPNYWPKYGAMFAPTTIPGRIWPADLSGRLYGDLYQRMKACCGPPQFPTAEQEQGYEAAVALMVADVQTFQFRNEDSRAMQLYARRLDQRFRVSQSLRTLAGDASTLAKNATDIMQSIEDGRARQDAAAAYFSTRIVNATDSNGQSVWSNIYDKLK